MKIIILILVLLYLGMSFEEVQYGNYIQIGTGRIKDTTSNYLATNKSLKVNGYLNATDSINTSVIASDEYYINGAGGGIHWRYYKSYITEGTDVLNYSSKSHTFVTKNGINNIAILDSATGLNLIYGNYYKNGTLLFDSSLYAHTTTGTETFSNNIVTSGYNDFGNTGNFEKRYFFKGKLSGAGSGTVNITHGLDWKHIIGFDCVVRNDTVDGSGNPVAGQLKFVKPQSWFGSYTYYAKIDSLYCTASVGNGANNNLINDSIFFTVWYRP